MTKMRPESENNLKFSLFFPFFWKKNVQSTIRKQQTEHLHRSKCSVHFVFLLHINDRDTENNASLPHRYNPSATGTDDIQP